MATKPAAKATPSKKASQTAAASAMAKLMQSKVMAPKKK